ncbi:MAG: GTP 3',8-cyclase MoaA [Crocinitomicaceae bacterium]|nr:GTP 3',8-cyclase MoaA [Crocinitomicaceae bacterium]
MHKTPQNIVDQFGRVHDYLRISLTERCNLRCFYCMPEEGIELRDKSCFMSSEEVLDIAKTFVGLGVKKIRLTGGEPLIKKDAKNVILQLGKLPVELAITTNGVLVDRFIDVFKEAGIKKVNVSLDSLNEQLFNKISRRSYFQKIKENISLLVKEGFETKINVVVIKDVNEHEIVDFVKWTQKENVHVRFIEFMPFDGNKWEWERKVSYKKIYEIIEKEYGANRILKIQDAKNDTSKNYRLFDGKGTFGVIASVTNPFCDTCNRIRLTADGKIKNCLFSQSETDLLTAHRNGVDIKSLIMTSILTKEKQRGGVGEFDQLQMDKMKNRSMIAIGG